MSRRLPGRAGLDLRSGHSLRGKIPLGVVDRADLLNHETDQGLIRPVVDHPAFVAQIVCFLAHRLDPSLPRRRWNSESQLTHDRRRRYVSRRTMKIALSGEGGRCRAKLDEPLCDTYPVPVLLVSVYVLPSWRVTVAALARVYRARDCGTGLSVVIRVFHHRGDGGRDLVGHSVALLSYRLLDTGNANARRHTNLLVLGRQDPEIDIADALGSEPCTLPGRHCLQLVLAGHLPHFLEVEIVGTRAQPEVRGIAVAASVDLLARHPSRMNHRDEVLAIALAACEDVVEAISYVLATKRMERRGDEGTAAY